MSRAQDTLHKLNILTDRLDIREWNNDQTDYNHMYDLESIPEVVRYQDWGPRSRERAAEVVREIVAGQAESPRTHVELAVFTKAGDATAKRFLGRVGSNIDLNAQLTKANLWFAFMPESHGKGYAAEAVEALIATLKTAGVKRVEIECDPRNEGSRRLAERLSFTKIKEVEKAWESKGEWVGSLEFARNLD